VEEHLHGLLTDPENGNGNGNGTVNGAGKVAVAAE
jgi:hypothetical protein